MRISVLYFGILREKYIHQHDEKIDVPVGATVHDLVGEICARHPDFHAVRQLVRVGVNEDIAGPLHRLTDGDVVALIPPVAGGADPYCRLTDGPLSIDEVVAAVSGPGQGAVVVFIGTVRDHNDGHEVTRLEYQAYAEMVHKVLRTIIADCHAIADGVEVAIAHRTGQLAIGDAAVVLAASAPHRAEAFSAARQAIEALKADAPIWKKEFSTAGVEWVGMRP